MLRKTAQRVLKAIHIASAGVWLGGLAGVVALLASGPAAATGRGRFGLDLAAYTIHEQILFWAFVVTLTTGLVFALFTPWGFFRHRWITAKWILAGVLFVTTLWLQRPQLGGVVGLSDAGVGAVGGRSYAAYRSSALDIALVQLAIVVVIFALSTLKPWGSRRGAPLHGRRRTAVLVAVVGAGLIGAGFGAWNHARLAALRALPVVDVDPSRLPDGTYRGAYDCGRPYAVAATIARGRVVAVVAIDDVDSTYGRLAEAVLARIVAAQTPAVDSITGATTSSRCLMKATERALLGAGARPPGDARADADRRTRE